MSVSKQQLPVQIWHLLKQPFVLPSAGSHTHVCVWKSIDAGLLVCELCGHIHACSDLRCNEVIENDDGSVCALSGMYIREKQYLATEYQDTVNLTDGKLSHRIIEETVYEDIKCIFNRLLISEFAEMLYLKQHIELITRWHHQLKRQSKHMILWCAALLQEAQRNVHKFDYHERAHVASLASKQCYNVLVSLVTQFGMCVKSNEVQELAVGLLYLMRSGIQIQGYQILPVIACLRHMLPPENMLKQYFDVRSKFITESENRAKLCLRKCSISQLQNIQFILPELKK